MQKLHIRKNDRVHVLTGKDQGKEGKVLHVMPEKGRALVEKIGMIYEHVRPNPQKNIKGGIVQKEGSVHVSNLKVVCPSCNQPTRVGRTILANGKFARTCKKCNTNID